ncbi:MAG: class I SAM-dependent methyltransferase [archaeon]
MNKIKEHYARIAGEFGASKQSTMKDEFVREKEVEKLIEQIGILKKQFKGKPKILEIGCGNGYTAERIVKELDLELTCIDFSKELLEVANKRNLEKAQFKLGDAQNLEFEDESFNIVFTERCIINLKTWENQKKALNEIHRVLKKEGVFLMIEAFTDGLKNLNDAREAVGLKPIEQPFHNNYLDKEKFLEFIENKFERNNKNQNLENFLSSYYFGSRALYAALIEGKKELVYNNKFIEFFKYLPPYGNYSYVQMLILKKINPASSK